MVSLSHSLAHFGYRPRAVLHVGANNGAELGEYRSIGIASGLLIEPVTTTFADLAARVESYPGYQAVQALISDIDDAPVTIRISSNQGESSSILPLATHSEHFPGITVTGEETLISTRLDSLLYKLGEIERYDLWVVDVEGAELHVLRGATKSLLAARVIMIEIHDEATHDGAPHWTEIRDFLADYGFKLKAMNITRYGFGDALFVKQEPLDGRATSDVSGFFKIGLNGSCSQSSLSPWSEPNDAEKALTNNKNDFAFHTNYEESPWWCIDFGTAQQVDLVKIFNREGARERAFSLYAEVSEDGDVWKVIHENRGWYFGGSATGPLSITLNTPPFRFLRVGLRQPNYLHLEKVEIYQRK